MNDRHPSGSSTPPASAPADHAPYAAYDQQSAAHGTYADYDGFSTGSFDTTGSYATAGPDTGSFATDPLFGDMPGSSYDTGQWATTGTQQTLNYDPYAAQHQAAYDTGGYETGGYDTTAMWSTGGHQHLSAEIPAQAGPEASGQWDATAWTQPQQTGQWETTAFDTGAYDATAWNSGGQDMTYGAEATAAFGAQDTPEAPDTYETAETYEHSPYETGSYASESYPVGEPGEQTPEAYAQPAPAEHEFTPDEAPADSLGPVEPISTDAAGDDVLPVMDRSHAPRSRSRRRSPAKRSALFTVAVPSACVMGVAGIAAASVGDFGGDEKEAQAATAPDPATVQPSAANNKLDTQLANLSADAGDFADRASRTQERIDLKAEKVAAQKKAAEEAARKERLRPKFALPVKQHGLSAYYGQAGINWMSAHSGIDFPVSYGTEVLAATDGTVSTKWNSAYGNMAIVTAKDGTETWYCHLSTHKVSSGPVKAGDPIAFSGNSGNSTGPHLHFEVRPGGGSAIDPMPWLRSHGLDPT
ncbi:peptidase [Streptomyces longisporoflavus]|uniref:M23 family metallopeptidase n=1 Tax=Streptomyces longisporoflavus TaxID=28044 RepID=UPI00167EDE6C|nr:M23 family metallopeptidase [Streptomyces longisporoflavus]GGV57663.1 peptidase [Streptomyces longisporoflavus]